MSKSKSTPGGPFRKKAEVSIVRSSAAEYLGYSAPRLEPGGGPGVHAGRNGQDFRSWHTKETNHRITACTHQEKATVPAPSRL